jgi:hypothetical protein
MENQYLKRGAHTVSLSRIIFFRMKPVPLTREAWLLFAVDHVATVFAEAGYAVSRVRVTCAIPATPLLGSAVPGLADQPLR